MNTVATSFLSTTRADLSTWLTSVGENPSHAKRLMSGYYRDAVLPSECDHINKRLRELLDSQFAYQLPQISTVKDSEDGTRKWLIQLYDGHTVETVFIPSQKRGTLCISSQVGCAMACQFCATGKQGFHRNLSADEILAQVVLAKRYNEQNPLSQTSLDSNISNVVFMGMGEPLLNEEAVYTVVDILLDDFAFGLAQNRVTVSTVGIVPAIRRFAERCRAALAISLHAPSDLVRGRIVPINGKFDLTELLDACRHYQALNPNRSITFEYVMLDGVNDQPEHVRQLANCLQGIDAKLNLIPFNPVPGIAFRPTPQAQTEQFAAQLRDHGLVVTVRTQRGDDITAACGQLAKLADEGRQRAPYPANLTSNNNNKKKRR